MTDAAIPVELDEPVVAIDGRDFTVSELIRLLGGFGGYAARSALNPPPRAGGRDRVGNRLTGIGSATVAGGIPERDLKRRWIFRHR